MSSLIAEGWEGARLAVALTRVGLFGSKGSEMSILMDEDEVEDGGKDG